MPKIIFTLLIIAGLSWLVAILTYSCVKNTDLEDKTEKEYNSSSEDEHNRNVNRQMQNIAKEGRPNGDDGEE